MPAVKYYEVEQTRVVKVQANNEIDAARIADAAFTNGQNTDNGARNGPEGVWGNTLTKIEVTTVHISKEL